MHSSLPRRPRRRNARMAPANDLRRVTGFEGNYGAYIEDLKRRKGPDADMPTRIKYKKLVRS